MMRFMAILVGALLALALAAPSRAQVTVTFPLCAPGQTTLCATVSGAPSTTPPAGTNYYFAAAGNDANPCTQAQPCQTIAKAQSITYRVGDQLLFKGGDAFSGCLAFTEGGGASSSAGTPFVIGSYGVGPPTITSNCSGTRSGLVALTNMNSVLLSNLTLRGNGSTECGVTIGQSDNSHATGSILLVNMDIGGFHSPAGSSDYCAHVFYMGYPGNPAGGIGALTITGSKLHGLNGPTDPDDNGISGFGYGQNVLHVNISGTQVYNIGGKLGNSNTGNGILIDGIGSSAYTDNSITKTVVHDIGANVDTCGGPAGIITYTMRYLTIDEVEVYNVQPVNLSINPCDRLGIDIDGGSQFVRLRHIYTHNNYGPGVQLWCQDTNGLAFGPVDTAWWISDGDSFGTRDETQGSFYYQAKGCTGGGNFSLTNSTLVQARVGGASVRPAIISLQSGAIGTIENNIFIAGGNDTRRATFLQTWGAAEPGVTFKNNGYRTWWGTFAAFYSGVQYSSLAALQAVIPGGETGARSDDPLLVGPIGQNIACNDTTGSQTCPAGYKLGAASLYRGAGMAQSNGAADFYLAPVTSIPIGASQ